MLGLGASFSIYQTLRLDNVTLHTRLDSKSDFRLTLGTEFRHE